MTHGDTGHILFILRSAPSSPLQDDETAAQERVSAQQPAIPGARQIL